MNGYDRLNLRLNLKHEQGLPSIKRSFFLLIVSMIVVFWFLCLAPNVSAVTKMYCNGSIAIFYIVAFKKEFRLYQRQTDDWKIRPSCNRIFNLLELFFCDYYRTNSGI
jgi:hypothetical protein